MANAYRYPKTTMGIILGTGTNAGKVFLVCPKKNKKYSHALFIQHTMKNSGISRNGKEKIKYLKKW